MLLECKLIAPSLKMAKTKFDAIAADPLECGWDWAADDFMSAPSLPFAEVSAAVGIAVIGLLLHESFFIEFGPAYEIARHNFVLFEPFQPLRYSDIVL